MNSRSVAVDVLNEKGWSYAGNYRPDRARALTSSLRATGAIVRMEGETPIRPRIGWRLEDGSGAWLGSINGIDLFGMIPTRMSEYLVPMPGCKWALYSLLPGKDQSSRTFDTDWEAQDAAERLLDKFVWNIGIRGARVDNSATENTVVLSPVVDEAAEACTQTAPDGLVPVTLIMDAVEGP